MRFPCLYDTLAAVRLAALEADQVRLYATVKLTFQKGSPLPASRFNSYYRDIADPAHMIAVYRAPMEPVPPPRACQYMARSSMIGSEADTLVEKLAAPT